MDVDGDEDETQRVLEVNDYGVVVDFEDLEEEEQEDGSTAMEETLLEAVSKLQAEIDKMSPNLKAIERCVALSPLVLAVLILIPHFAQTRRLGSALQRD